MARLRSLRYLVARIGGRILYIVFLLCKDKKKIQRTYSQGDTIAKIKKTKNVRKNWFSFNVIVLLWRNNIIINMEHIILEIIFEWIIKKIIKFFWEIGKKVFKSWKKGRGKSPSPTINRIIELEKYSPLAPDLYLLLVDSCGLLLAVSKAPKSYRLYILFFFKIPFKNTRI